MKTIEQIGIYLTERVNQLEHQHKEASLEISKKPMTPEELRYKMEQSAARDAALAEIQYLLEFICEDK